MSYLSLINFARSCAAYRAYLDSFFFARSPVVIDNPQFRPNDPEVGPYRLSEEIFRRLGRAYYGDLPSSMDGAYQAKAPRDLVDDRDIDNRPLGLPNPEVGPRKSTRDIFRHLGRAYYGDIPGSVGSQKMRGMSGFGGQRIPLAQFLSSGAWRRPPVIG